MKRRAPWIIAASVTIGLMAIAGAVLHASSPRITLMLAVTAFVSSGLRITYRGREYETLHTMLLFLCFFYGGIVSGLLAVLILASGSAAGIGSGGRIGVFHLGTALQALLIVPFALLSPRGALPYPAPVYLALVPLLYLARRITVVEPPAGRWRSLAFLGFLTNVPAVLLAVHVTETFGPVATVLFCLLCVLYLFLVRRETLEIGRRTARLVHLTEHNAISRSLLSAVSLTEFVAGIEVRTGPGLHFYEKAPDGWLEWTSSGCVKTAGIPSCPVDGREYRTPGIPGVVVMATDDAARSAAALDADEAADFYEQLARNWQVVSARIHQEEALFSVALLLARIADLKDRYTKMHSLRVAELSTAIGREIGLSEGELSMLRTGALLHDIGKVSLPSEILGKKGILTYRERNIIKSHPGEGAALVSGLSRFRKAAETVLHHHERLDGSGYPNGLRGSAIPLHSRIVAVADTFDAITADRPYHPEGQSENALREIQAGRGTLYDARVVDALSRLVEGGTW